MKFEVENSTVAGPTWSNSCGSKKEYSSQIGIDAVSRKEEGDHISVAAPTRGLEKRRALLPVGLAIAGARTGDSLAGLGLAMVGD